MVDLSPAVTFLGSAAIAIAGWIYTARRQRNLLRKQHTFNALLQTSFNEQYNDALKAVRPFTDHGKTVTKDADLSEQDKVQIRFLINHLEFIAAGIRNGDIDERLFRDTERGTVLRLYASFETYIYQVRSERRRDAIYEHFEWLNDRWQKNPPPVWQRCIERIRARPFYGKRRASK
ncbi:MAG: DUF4760 domain-containing protein [Rhodospirillales bacterium]|nr:DUF4760 domain-containing protein [Rhodospirillales bacterium]